MVKESEIGDTSILGTRGLTGTSKPVVDGRLVGTIGSGVGRGGSPTNHVSHSEISEDSSSGLVYLYLSYPNESVDSGPLVEGPTRGCGGGGGGGVRPPRPCSLPSPDSSVPSLSLSDS